MPYPPPPWTASRYQETHRQPSGAGASCTQPRQPNTPSQEPPPPPHPAWREVAGTCPSEAREPLPGSSFPPKDLSTCLLHASSLGATGRRNNENWMQLGFCFFKGLRYINTELFYHNKQKHITGQTLRMRGNTAMYTPEALACAARPRLRHCPGPRPSASGLGIVIVYVCVSFLYKICTQSTPVLGKDGPDQIQYRKTK